MGKDTPASVDAMKYGVILVENDHPNALELLLKAIDFSEKYKPKLHDTWRVDFENHLKNKEYDKAIFVSKQMIAIGDRTAFSLLCKGLRNKFTQTFNELYSNPFAAKQVLDIYKDIRKWGVATNPEMWKIIDLLKVQNSRVNPTMWHFVLDQNEEYDNNQKPQLNPSEYITRIIDQLLVHQERFDEIEKTVIKYINTQLVVNKKSQKLVDAFKSNFVRYLTSRKFDVNNYGDFEVELRQIFDGLIDLFGDYGLLDESNLDQKVVNPRIITSFYTKFITSGPKI